MKGYSFEGFTIKNRKGQNVQFSSHVNVDLRFCMTLYNPWRRVLRIPRMAKRMKKRLSLKKSIRLSHYTHTNGKTESVSLKKLIIIRMSKGKQNRGRPNMRWMEEIKGTTKLTMDELRETTRDMIAWRQLILNVNRSHAISRDIT